MKDNVFIKAPAKLNLFLNIIGHNNNGYHNICTGITFLDLYDEINISLSDKNNLSYNGPFKPSSSIYKNDIIHKVLSNVSMEKEKRLKLK